MKRKLVLLSLSFCATFAFGQYKIKCKREWQECSSCHQKKEIIYKVADRGFISTTETTPEYCEEVFLSRLTKRLNLEFELGKGFTMIYPDFTEKIIMAEQNCNVNPTRKHSFITQSVDFIDVLTEESYNNCKQNSPKPKN